MALPKTVDAQTLGDLIGLTARRVRQLAAEGVFEKSGRGRYPLAGCVQAYVGYWQVKVDEARNADGVDYKEARRRKVSAEAKLKELELQIKRGELVPSEDVDGRIRAALEPVDVALRTAHSRLAREWSERLGVTEGEAVHLVRDMADDVRGDLVRILKSEEAEAVA